MKYYYYYSKKDPLVEKLDKVLALSRLGAAQWFAKRKRLSLKAFLNIYKITK